MATNTNVVNDAFLRRLESPGLEKQAVDAVNDFTRLKMREDGIFRRVMPPLEIANTDLSEMVNTDKPAKIVSMEPDNPAAVTLPFNSLPLGVNIRTRKYPVFFERIVSPRFYKDVEELHTYTFDIRQILSDNAIKDMLATEDGTLISAINTILVGQNATVPFTGSQQWVSLTGGVTRVNWAECKKVMPRTPSHLEVHTAVVNNITVKDIEKWDRIEAGGDLSQELLVKGYTQSELGNIRMVVTIKRNLVPDDTMFQFADPKFIGKFFILNDVTMAIKREAFMLDYYAYETIGAAIGNAAGVCRVDFV